MIGNNIENSINEIWKKRGYPERLRYMTYGINLFIT